MGIRENVADKTNNGNAIDCEFKFDLFSEQESAYKSSIDHPYGVLSAVTGLGKTVLAGKKISDRKTNILILVHRQQLLEQWREKLIAIFVLDNNEIGRFSDGKDKLTGNIDIAMLQSLTKKGEVKLLVTEYGQIIVDECHHISAFSFEKVLKKSNPKYVLGLTATPIRKDGHHPIIMMQCRPIRYRISSKSQIKKSQYNFTVYVRYSDLRVSNLEPDSNISQIYSRLIKNDSGPFSGSQFDLESSD